MNMAGTPEKDSGTLTLGQLLAELTKQMITLEVSLVIGVHIRGPWSLKGPYQVLKTSLQVKLFFKTLV